jgi:uncharacterized protein (DUF433 family)
MAEAPNMAECGVSRTLVMRVTTEGWFRFFSPYNRSMRTLSRITADPQVMGGRPCIRGIRVTVGTIVGLVASGHSRDEILKLYPYLEADDIGEALAYAAWRSDEFEVPISPR